MAGGSFDGLLQNGRHEIRSNLYDHRMEASLPQHRTLPLVHAVHVARVGSQPSLRASQTAPSALQIPTPLAPSPG